MIARRASALGLAIAVLTLLGKSGTAFEPVEVSVTESPSLGRQDAPVTLVEFSDYECFYCRRHAVQIQPRIVETYVETGSLRYVVREFPPEDTDSPGFRAAEAALCAGGQGRYWKMRRALYDNQQDLSAERLVAYAQSLGLEMVPFEQCLAERTYRDQALQSYLDGKSLGINAVPTFFLGLTDPDDPGRIRASVKITGSKFFEVYASAIDGLLSQAAGTGKAGSEAITE